MKTPLLVAALGLCALPARGDDETARTLALQQALTPIDSTPLRADLVAVAGDDEAAALGLIIGFATDPATDVGVQLRAIRTLPQFCPASCAGSEPHATLRAVVVQAARAPASGVNLLRLRAGIEALGATRTGDLGDVALLVATIDVDGLALLSNASRDIRAATAHALRDLCRATAIPPLRDRLAAEPSVQVKIALTRALQDLTRCPL